MEFVPITELVGIKIVAVDVAIERLDSPWSVSAVVLLKGEAGTGARRTPVYFKLRSRAAGLMSGGGYGVESGIVCHQLTEAEYTGILERLRSAELGAELGLIPGEAHLDGIRPKVR